MRSTVKHAGCITLASSVLRCVLSGAQGTASSKKKKQAKLKRVMHTVKKQARRERADGAEGFAAIQLLHDPQVLQARFRSLHGVGSSQGI